MSEPLSIDETRRRIEEIDPPFVCCDGKGWYVANDIDERMRVYACTCLDSVLAWWPDLDDEARDALIVSSEDVAILPEAIAALRAAEARIRRAEGPE